MADKKASNANANKTAMSRALGAAFLSHQVEQLEKTVSSSSANWRDRKNPILYNSNGPGGPKRGSNSPGIKVAQRKIPAKERKDNEFDRSVNAAPGIIRRSYEEQRKDKDADVVVVDASVLIHALYQVKKWCREGREEVIIVPLEALNTLDLLKKGTSSLAQKARTASRILEAQVGTNPRIRVQRDDAFVLWDKISFNSEGTESSPTNSNVNSCPEWVRRIICCARWETEHPEEELKPVHAEKLAPMKVVLAVLSTLPNMSPQSMAMNIASSAEAPLTPVPLPAPTATHANRYEARSTGSLVASWAAKAGISLLEVDPALPGRGGEDDDRGHGQKRSQGSNRGRRPSTSDSHGPKSGLVERPPAVMAMMEMISQPSKVVRVLARGEKLDPDP
ncbi:hypothetical protein JR316_0012664 [Psilocybe cubensis]|uniref:Uncharacterized protein n=2 Tax=Psilocybe cubensis TaxID=181762 RepID=A0ACB8GKF7_PSICU|nr:hypothetical protein JR316_0012664 [Psilocybe cubensis]KAH9475549.1 hypothetical protein JR316_0012664 [Psilocybe cubensis]